MLSSWTDIRVLSLDLDNTLWDVGPPLDQAEVAVREWLERECPTAAPAYTLDRLLAVRKRVAQRYPERHSDLSYIRREVLRAILTEAGYDGGRAEEAFGVFFAARNRVQLYPDVDDALAALSRRYRLVALTNGNADLSVIGLDHYFEHYICAAKVGTPKPAAAMFAAVSDATGATPEQIVHIGDDPEHDVAGARAAGMRSVWVNRLGETWRGTIPAADAEISSLAELLV